MTSSPFFAPNSKAATLERWRRDGRLRAIGAITLRGGSISGTELGAILGMSPRALRHILVRDGHFLVEYRAMPNQKDQAWYRVRPDTIEVPINLPPIRREAQLDGSKAPRVHYRGGPTPAIERFAAVPRIQL